jgi:uncharacterized membrane protein YfcA
MNYSLDVMIMICFVSFSIAFMKGAFGGGLAAIGIPLLSLVMPPFEAAALIAPLLVLMDAFSLRYWSPQTWSKPDLIILIPAMLVGVCTGTLLINFLPPNTVSIIIAIISLIFSFFYFSGHAGKGLIHPSKGMGFIAGYASGCATMIANAGGPPLSMYLLSRHLSKTHYTGTASIVAASGNVMKLFPWLLIASLDWGFAIRLILAVPFIFLGVFWGYKLNQRLDQKKLFTFCHCLLIILSLKMLWTAL